jgi:hypothetical protein
LKIPSQSAIIFSYDAGASLHLSTHQLINTHGAHSRKERHHPLIFSSRIQGVIQALIEDKMEEKIMLSHKLEIRSPLIG